MVVRLEGRLWRKLTITGLIWKRMRNWGILVGKRVGYLGFRDGLMGLIARVASVVSMRRISFITEVMVFSEWFNVWNVVILILVRIYHRNIMERLFVRDIGIIYIIMGFTTWWFMFVLASTSALFTFIFLTSINRRTGLH